MRLALSTLAGMVAGAHAVASEPTASCTLEPGGEGVVARVLDGDTLALKDGRVVRLIGALAPKVPPGREKERRWRLAQMASRALRDLVKDQRVALSHGGRKTDRHGRLLAHVFVLRGPERVWAQREMIARGRVRAYSFADNRACLAELLKAEAGARAARRGLWRARSFSVRDATDASQLRRLVNSFQIVEGEVAAIGSAGGRLFINFGDNWRTDFTGVIAARDKKRLTKSGTDVQALKGRRVRLRGWIGWRYGPMISITHPEQIEILEKASGKSVP